MESNGGNRPTNRRTQRGAHGQDIELAGVEMRFGTQQGTVFAVDTTDLTVRHREFLVLLGPSGCGKTTILRIIAGLLRPSAGQVRIGDRDLWIGGQRDRRAVQELGVVFQDANLFPWLSVEQNIALPLKLRGVGRRERLNKARELSELVGISGFEKRWPRELSGGMRQRAAIARALSYDPEILLMDEPFGALDAMTREQMNLELQRIWMALGCTIVFVTHSIPEAAFLGDRVVLMSARPGRINAVTTVAFERPRKMAVQSSPRFQTIVKDLRQRLEHM